jgi:hypothetical protein
LNVKRAVAAAVCVLGALILVVALGAGYLAGHSSSARAGASTATQNAAPVKVTVDAYIYGDSATVPAIYGDANGVPAFYGDGNGVSPGPTTSTSTTTSGDTITVTPMDGTGAGVSADIYGD